MAKNDNSKLAAILSYVIIGIVWYFVDDKVKNDPFVKFHVRQAVNLYIILISLMILFELFSFYAFLAVVKLIVFLLLLVGLITAFQGKKRPVPFVGQWAEKYLNF